MAKRMNRFESVVIDSDQKGRLGVYHITRFPMTGTVKRRLLFRDAEYRFMRAYAQGYAEEAKLHYQEVE